MRTIIPSAAARSRSMMMAVVLGAALTAGENSAVAARPDLISAEYASAPDAIRDITRYCQVCWRNARLPADRWDDCTQQVFARLLERVSPSGWHTLVSAADGDDRREFIRAIDAVKKRTQRARRYVDLPTDFADERNRDGEALRDQREAVDLAARTLLSPRQQRIVELTANGWAVPDIAVELRTTPERISDEKYKAIQKLRTHFGSDA